MFRVIDRSSILILGLAMATTSAFADDLPDQAQADQPPTEVVFVTESAPEVTIEQHGDLDQEVATMVESELMLNLVARLTLATPQI
jgi:hypothetical protein